MWLRGILAARWFPYVLTGCLAVVIAVFGYGYSRGYGSAEATYTEAMNQALADQLTRERATAKSDLAAAVRTASRSSSIVQGIKSIRRTDADCNTTEWLRVFNDGVRVVNASTATAN